MLNTLQTKPLLCFCLVFLTGSCAAVYIPTLPKLILTGLFLLSAVIAGILGGWIFRRIPDGGRMKKLLVAVLLCAFAALGVSLLTFDVYASRFSRKAGAEDSVTLEITEVVYTSSFNSRYYADVLESDTFGSRFRIFLDSPDNSYLPRDRMTGTITYKNLEEDINGYNERRYALSQRVVIAADALSLNYEGRNSGFSFSYFFRDLNDALAEHLFRYTGEEEGGLGAALLLGNKTNLSDSLERDFRRLGIIHLLCLSGAHLAILTTLMERILLRLKIGKKKRCFINITAVLLYMALTGFPPSLTRAGIMLILANLAYLVGRRHDYPTSLTFSCALITALNPFSALDYGLHLSFAAAHSCFISSVVSHRFSYPFTIRKKTRFRRAVRQYNRFIRKVMATAVFNLIITVVLLPFMWLYYGELSLFSLPANIIYIPLITLLMYAVIGFYLLSPLMIFSVPLAKGIVLLTRLISWSAERLSSLRGIVLSLNYWFTPVFMIPLVILAVCSFSGKRKTIRRASCLGICVFALFLGTVGIQTALTKGEFAAEYVSKGRNDGFLVKSDGGLMVCEVSDGSHSFASLLTSHRYDFNCTEIEAYLLTHYHKRHITALEKLTDECIVRALVLPEPVTETDTEVFASLSKMAEEKHIQLILTHRGNTDTVYFNDTELETYPLTLLSRSDHPIIALRITQGEDSIMYLGGSFNEGDERITEHAAEADCIILGGHNPIYKKAFDPGIAESKTVYLSDYGKEALEKLSHDITGELDACEILTGETIHFPHP